MDSFTPQRPASIGKIDMKLISYLRPSDKARDNNIIYGMAAALMAVALVIRIVEVMAS